jgi:uncharacterized DUF497 family protein
MTSKQMVRAMKKHGISLVYIDGLWWAGQTVAADTSMLGKELRSVMLVKTNGSQHVGHEAENAVEDYCNANDLEWDV